MAFPFRLAISAALLLTLASLAAADSRDDAIMLERTGDRLGARSLYISWIRGNPDHPDAPDVLLHAVGLTTDADDALELMRSLVEELPGVAAAGIYSRMASLASIMGRIAPAATYYERAAEGGLAEADRHRLAALALRYAMGEYRTVRNGALLLSRRAGNPLIAGEAAALAASALSELGDSRSAMDEITAAIDSGADSPLLWMVLREAALDAGDNAAAGRAAAELSEDYPTSTANYLVRSMVMRWESPGILRAPETVEIQPGSPVQAGAFQGRDGAAELRRRLEEDGFTAWIESDGGLWRVFVNDSDGTAAERLAKKGYEASFRR